MKTHQRFRVLFTIVTIAPGMAALLGASECRFGNHVEYAKEPVAGVYEMAPTSVILTAQLDTGAAPSLTGTEAQIPAYLAVSLTNPVYVYVDPKNASAAALTNPSGSGKYAFPIILNPNGQIPSFINKLSPNPVWFAECQEHLDFSVDGQVRQGVGPLTTGAAYDIRGRIRLHVIAKDSFVGDCAPSLAAAAACLESLSQCTGGPAGLAQDNQDYLRSIFGVHLDAGVLSTSQMANLVSVAHELIYE